MYLGIEEVKNNVKDQLKINDLQKKNFFIGLVKANIIYIHIMKYRLKNLYIPSDQKYISIFTEVFFFQYFFRKSKIVFKIF